MAEDLSWAPSEVDLSKPNSARVYDYLIGGGCNFQIDREFADQLIADLPEIQLTARLNRSFLRRAVRHCAELGISQFVDLGAGIPTVGPTHEIAARVRPDSKVLYVDNEAIAIAHGHSLLQDNENATALQADLRNPDDVMNAAAATELIDFEQPVAVLALAVLHFVPDADEIRRLLAHYRDAIAPGSYLILSHATAESTVGENANKAASQYQKTASPLQLRSREEITGFFAGFDLIEPGLVYAPEWHPEDQDESADIERTPLLVGVGRK